MITEGIGPKAPTPTTLVFTEYDLWLIHQDAKERAEHRGYKAKRGTWEQGLKSDVVIEGVGLLTRDVRPVFAGLMGEYGLQEYLRKRFGGRLIAQVDVKLRKYGDFGIDLVAYGLTMQVKTRQSAKWGNLIRRVNARGAVLSLPAQGFVFCQWNGDQAIHLLGWCWTRDIERRTPVPAIVGEHKNIEVMDHELLPMCRLVDELEARSMVL